MRRPFKFIPVSGPPVCLCLFACLVVEICIFVYFVRPSLRNKLAERHLVLLGDFILNIREIWMFFFVSLIDYVHYFFFFINFCCLSIHYLSVVWLSIYLTLTRFPPLSMSFSLTLSISLSPSLPITLSLSHSLSFSLSLSYTYTHAHTPSSLSSSGLF